MDKATTHQRAAFSALLRLSLIGVLLLGTVLFSGNASRAAPAPDASGFDAVKLPPKALTAPIKFPLRTASSPKMETALTALAAVAHTSAQVALMQAQAQSLRVDGDRVQLLITTDAARADAATSAVRQVGGEVTGRANGDRWLQAWAPMAALEALAADESIDYVSRPIEALTTATTEGAAVINAPAWQAAGYKGAGVKVAIIDSGFKGYKALLGTELPATVIGKNFVDGESSTVIDGTTEHGTACAEVVHDLAPAAALYLAKSSTAVDLQEAVNWAKSQGVQIISTSLVWYSLTPGDGTGFFADLVQSARNAGIFWTTAAGNDRQAHWGGPYSRGTDGWHQFAGTQLVDFFGPGDGWAYELDPGIRIRAYLRWDDWTAKNQDYDLFVVRWDGEGWEIVGQSTDEQNGGAGQTPTEYVDITTSGAAAPYGIAIARYAGNRNTNLELFIPGVTRLDKFVTPRSLANLADSPAAMTVAALDVKSPYNQEVYSAEGPTNGPGGTATGGAKKPDIAGFANVATVSYPKNGFNGTSSATPHVAGAAALVKSANPGWTPAQIQSFLEGRAVDKGTTGKDTIFGWGALYLGAPFGVNPASKKVFLPAVARPLMAPVLNMIDSGGASTYSVSWGTVASATSYVLEEATNDAFSGASTVYDGPGTVWYANDKAPATYYYRVKATSGGTSSAWSNVQSVVVEACLTGPKPGIWLRSDGNLKFIVSADGKHVDYFGLYLNLPGCPGWLTNETPAPITDDRFKFTGPLYAYGQFTSCTTAKGEFALTSYLFCGIRFTTSPAGWTATWVKSAE